ncbi:hypothetical protein [Spirosoma montaniterrae]|uniref:Uncharacterized protein n=1 Tax=Spirosoma montaniterrae TaxID=1178516 RepID=A0A1P9WVN4_9BACT|nr:hypothetical protein [Spirosoma montaniterrae]AQG79423.1 hypothetical protein AWR27_08870 [Spirosoma montaniterrae]
MKTVLLGLFAFLPSLLFAQTYKVTPDDLARRQSYLLMRDGSTVRGQILRQDSILISVRKRNGNMSFVEADQVIRVVGDAAAVPKPAFGSENTILPYQVFVMRDGARVEGTFVRRDSTMITVRKRNGQLTYFEPELLLRTDTLSMETVGELTGMSPNRFAPWLLTGNTAHNAEKGRFYYRNTWLSRHELQYGITRFWSVGATFITPIPYLATAENYYGSGLYSWNMPRLYTQLSAGVGPLFRAGVNASFTANQLIGSSKTGGQFTLQGLLSFGSSQNNVTLGYSIAVPKFKYVLYPAWPSFSSSMPPQPVSVSVANQQLLSFGVIKKVSPKLTVVSDNSVSLGKQYRYYSYADGRARVSLALRFDRKRHAFDAGAYMLIYEKPFLWEGDKKARLFPYIGYNLIIGKD